MDTPVTGAPRVLLRLEGLALLVAALLGYEALNSSWWLFALHRVLGLGLKFPSAFRDTHLGAVGRAVPTTSGGPRS